MKKIVFILNSTSTPIGFKRINEFISNGYDVDVYGFERDSTLPSNIPIEIIGFINNSKAYYTRVLTIIKGIKKVIQKYKHQNVTFYVRGLELAFFMSLFSKKRYIYEECDLVHTYMRNALMVKIFEKIDLYTIKRSILTVFTSEGFLKYHFGDCTPDNVYILTNRLPISVTSLQKIPKKTYNISSLSIGFVGFIRFKSIYNFSRVICESFPNITFHFFGIATDDKDKQLFAQLATYPNCIFHGAFRNPDDLPKIYASIDLVLATYDVDNDNVRYAEPNKIYEAIYFDTPIIVSSSTYLAEKVKKLGIGFDVDATSENSIVTFINNLTEAKFSSIIENLKHIDKNSAININIDFFAKLSMLLNG